MTDTQFPTLTAALAFLTALIIMAGVLFLAIMFVAGQPWGTLNDICNGLGAVLAAAMAVVLFAQHQAHSPQLSLAALILAIVGAIIAVIGSWLILSGRTDFFLAGMYTMTGYALIGLWLVALSYGGPWPQNVVTFGLIAGAVMALGLAAIPSIFLRIDSFEAARWHTWLGQAGFIGWGILFPLWCLRFLSLLRGG